MEAIDSEDSRYTKSPILSICAACGPFFQENEIGRNGAAAGHSRNWTKLPPKELKKVYLDIYIFIIIWYCKRERDSPPASTFQIDSSFFLFLCPLFLVVVVTAKWNPMSASAPFPLHFNGYSFCMSSFQKIASIVLFFVVLFFNSLNASKQ